MKKVRAFVLTFLILFEFYMIFCPHLIKVFSRIYLKYISFSTARINISIG